MKIERERDRDRERKRKIGNDESIIKQRTERNTSKQNDNEDRKGHR